MAGQLNIASSSNTTFVRFHMSLAKVGFITHKTEAVRFEFLIKWCDGFLILTNWLFPQNESFELERSFNWLTWSTSLWEKCHCSVPIQIISKKVPTLGNSSNSIGFLVASPPQLSDPGGSNARSEGCSIWEPTGHLIPPTQREELWLKLRFSGATY